MVWGRISYHYQTTLHDCRGRMREREMFYLTMHSTHFIYGYMASDIWLRTILIVRKETRCRHIGYSYRLAARVLLYAPSHIQDSTYHGLCYTSRGALAGTRNSSMGPPHEGSIRRPTAPWANTLPLSYVPLLFVIECCQLPGLNQLFKDNDDLMLDLSSLINIEINADVGKEGIVIGDYNISIPLTNPFPFKECWWLVACVR